MKVSYLHYTHTVNIIHGSYTLLAIVSTLWHMTIVRKMKQLKTFILKIKYSNIKIIFHEIINLIDN